MSARGDDAMPVQNVGIAGISMYFPKTFVRQSELEKSQGIDPGKYTIGLGQIEMAFTSDQEDVVSIALNATQSLIDEYQIDVSTIGFLAVGTETLIDKSKSVKTELMRLFGENGDIEGVDVKNACFGGTQAVFHAVDWIYANYNTEKRNAIAVLADIAVYEEGPARCTGGVGALAVLITPDAPIVFEKGLRGTYMAGTWDFFKPIGNNVLSEYPVVHGKDSLASYMNSLHNCYRVYREKAKKLYGQDVSLRDFSGAMFHSPFTKMVQKAFARLFHEDVRRGVGHEVSEELLRALNTCDIDKTGNVSKEAIQASSSLWQTMTSPNLLLNRHIGNMYTPSLFAQLIVFLSRNTEDSRSVPSNRLLLFAYGSGSAASMFSLRVNGDLGRMAEVSRNIVSRLEKRTCLSPEEYLQAMKARELFLHNKVPFSPSVNLPMFDGSYKMTKMDEHQHRYYERHSIQNGS